MSYYERIGLYRTLKVVPEGYHRYFFGVKVKAVKLIGGRRFLAARSGLNVRTYSKSILRLLLCLQSPTGKKAAFLTPKSCDNFLGKRFSGDQFYSPVLALLLDVY